MSESSHPHTTKSGHTLTEAELDAFVAEAERGYNVDELVRRPGRPLLGSAPAIAVPVRLHADLHSTVKLRAAAAASTSVSDLIRQALVIYLDSQPPVLGAEQTRSGHALSPAETEALSAEAEAGYDASVLRPRAVRASARAKVVPVRLPPELKAAVERRADLEATSVSEVIRSALRAHLSDREPDPPPSGPRRRTSGHRPTETDTCRDYVLPRLKEAGWGDDQILEQFRITDGRIVSIGKKHRRAAPLRADYVLEYQPALPIAVVEAKREHAIPGKGLQQAKNYAQLLDVPFAFSTNGKGNRRGRPEHRDRARQPHRVSVT